MLDLAGQLGGRDTLTGRIGAALIGAILVTVAAAGPALGWSQLYNNYPGSPSNCSNADPYLCIKWPRLANGQSITVWVFRDLSLQDDPHVNLYQDAYDGFTRWNAVPANEPFLKNSTSFAGSTGYYGPSGYGTVVFRDDLGCNGILGSTWVPTFASDTHTIPFFQTTMNSSARFDHTLDFHVTGTPDPECPEIAWADSRKVVTHEEGHGLGLGHSGLTAIMKQGATTYFTIQTDDVSGLQAIYGAP